MSYTPDTTNGQASINVDNSSTPHVTVTHRVKSAGGHVIWFVFNATSESVRVCVENFQQEGTTVSSSSYTFFGSNCVDPVPPGQMRVLHVRLTGQPGSVYTYDVTVNDNVAADPELEI